MDEITIVANFQINLTVVMRLIGSSLSTNAFEEHLDGMKKFFECAGDWYWYAILRKDFYILSAE